MRHALEMGEKKISEFLAYLAVEENVAASLWQRFMSDTCTALARSASAGVECMRLRVKDLDFGQRQILVRDAKGGKDRVTILPNPVGHYKAVARAGPGQRVRGCLLA